MSARLATGNGRRASGNWPLARLSHGLLFALCALLFDVAFAKDDFLAPEQAYKYTARVEGNQLIVTWKIEKGYYLYKKKMAIASTMATVQLGTPAWPKGEKHSDEYFGEQEVYRGTVDIPVEIKPHSDAVPKLQFELKLQGCADAGLCYPPLTWKGEAPLSNLTAKPKADGGGLSAFTSKTSGNAQDFLPPDEAFKFGASMERPDSVALTWLIAKDYYLYKERLSVTTDTANVQIGKLQLPKAEPKHDEYLGDTEVYHDFLEASLPVARAAGSTGKLNLRVTYQGCAEAGLCYTPIIKTVTLDLPPTDTATALPFDGAPAGTAAAGTPVVAEQDQLASVLREGNLAYALLLFFGAGLLLSLTPCVLPMIPIVSGIIAGQGENLTRARGFSLAFTYVQGMAITYAAAGAIFVLAFKQAPQAFFQQPWIIVLFAALFVALALAMFGAYNLQLPSSLQTRLTDASNRQKSGTYVGTFVMGALSALVVTACVAPAIIGALSVISQSRQVFRGAAALYATGLGMGVPLLIVGASAGSLLPRVGPWMDTVKQLFGVLFLAVAIYLLQPLLPAAAIMVLWSGLAAISGFWVFSLKARDGGPAPAPVRAVGLIALVYGIILLIGATSGSRDPLQPLSHLRGVAGANPSVEHGLAFRRIKTVADLEGALAAAHAEGRPLMLDFYADWCASCKEMEKYTFTDGGVQAALDGAVLLQADVTANDEEDQALLKRFEIFGPPTIAFFGADGIERKNFRLVGFTPAERFREHVTAAFSS